MADSAQHSHHEGRDGVPEAAAATITTDASDPSSAPSTHHPYSRPVRSSTHVDIGFFDPAGVSELSRTLSQQGAGESSRADRSDRNNSPSATSDFTIIPTDEPFDLEKTLRNIIKKLDESEIKRRELGVVFKDLCVLGTRAPFAHQPTVGSMANPLNAFKLLWRMRRPHTRNLLSGFEGVLRPGEMLLVLGRPGAGCSTLLRIIANQREGFHAVVGDVHYDSFTPEEIHKHYRGDVQYCPEEDIHFPTLTVEQTLRFAARTRTPETRISSMSRKRHIDMCVEVLLTVFGLRNVKNSLVGDASIRGISGGEKKRVSITEALATRSRLTAWDNSTRGLDASTALEFIRALRIATDIGRVSTVVAAYQAGSLYTSSLISRQTTSDFLVAVTDPNGRAVRPGYEARAPRTAGEFADYLLKSELGQINRDDMNSYDEEFASKPTRASAYKESALAEHARHTNPKSPYIISISMQARALMTRRMQIIKGVMAPQIIRTGYVLHALIIVYSLIYPRFAERSFFAIIVGTVFLRLKPTTITFFSRGGVLFFALMFSALTAMAEIPALFSQRPIVLRHSKAAMYHPFVEALALTLVDLPITFVTMVIFSIILYFLVGLQQTASQFFIFLLLILTLAVTMKAWFRALAAAFQRPAPAQTIAGISVMILVLYTGYPLPQPYMIGALNGFRGSIRCVTPSKGF
ncbi:Multidrug resistance protein CDR2 [Grifola frondosa]|uniref:Multidrug resistance protein CDR2 n=1 Tax=Grifola frondosa TaxID=5627 RepID=A0A1C7M9C9_GRIFR|nr:Multidrug resistance protein CDR2 [Grifola frondosa]